MEESPNSPKNLNSAPNSPTSDMPKANNDETQEKGTTGSSMEDVCAMWTQKLKIPNRSLQPGSETPTVASTPQLKGSLLDRISWPASNQKGERQRNESERSDGESRQRVSPSRSFSSFPKRNAKNRKKAFKAPFGNNRFQANTYRQHQNFSKIVERSRSPQLQSKSSKPDYQSRKTQNNNLRGRNLSNQKTIVRSRSPQGRNRQACNSSFQRFPRRRVQSRSRSNSNSNRTSRSRESRLRHESKSSQERPQSQQPAQSVMSLEEVTLSKSRNKTKEKSKKDVIPVRAVSSKKQERISELEDSKVKENGNSSSFMEGFTVSFTKKRNGADWTKTKEVHMDMNFSMDTYFSTKRGDPTIEADSSFCKTIQISETEWLTLDGTLTIWSSNDDDDIPEDVANDADKHDQVSLLPESCSNPQLSLEFLQQKPDVCVETLQKDDLLEKKEPSEEAKRMLQLFMAEIQPLEETRKLNSTPLEPSVMIPDVSPTLTSESAKSTVATQTSVPINNDQTHQPEQSSSARTTLSMKRTVSSLSDQKSLEQEKVKSSSTITKSGTQMNSGQLKASSARTSVLSVDTRATPPVPKYGVPATPSPSSSESFHSWLPAHTTSWPVDTKTGNKHSYFELQRKRRKLMERPLKAQVMERKFTKRNFSVDATLSQSDISPIPSTSSTENSLFVSPSPPLPQILNQRRHSTTTVIDALPMHPQFPSGNPSRSFVSTAKIVSPMLKAAKKAAKELERHRNTTVLRWRKDGRPEDVMNSEMDSLNKASSTTASCSNSTEITTSEVTNVESCRRHSTGSMGSGQRSLKPNSEEMTEEPQ